MPEQNAPSTWTRSGVRKDPSGYFRTLEESGRRCIRRLRDREYPAAAAELGQMLDGLTVLQSAGVGDLYTLLSELSTLSGIVLYACDEIPEEERREAALADLRDAIEFAREKKTKAGVRQITEIVAAGESFTALKRKVCPVFPLDTLDLLEDVCAQLEGYAKATPAIRRGGGVGRWLALTLCTVGLCALAAVGFFLLLTTPELGPASWTPHL